jgi:hypothetical protein
MVKEKLDSVMKSELPSGKYVGIQPMAAGGD